MKKFKNIIKSALCVTLAAAILTAFCSCQTEPPKIEEVRDTYAKLIEESYEINDILFGDGMKVYGRDSEYAKQNGIYKNVPDGYYSYEFITEENKYQTEDEIREKALEIYSKDYISPVLDSCFVGFMDEEGGTAVQPKYLSYTGKLMMNSEYEVRIRGERRYDTSTIEIVKPSNGEIVNVRLDATEGGVTEKVQLTFVLQDGQWRLDTPTY